MYTDSVCSKRFIKETLNNEEKILLATILLLIAVFALTFTACDDGVVTLDKLKIHQQNSHTGEAKGQNLLIQYSLIQLIRSVHTPDAASSDVRDRFGR